MSTIDAHVEGNDGKEYGFKFGYVQAHNGLPSGHYIQGYPDPDSAGNYTFHSTDNMRHPLRNIVSSLEADRPTGDVVDEGNLKLLGKLNLGYQTHNEELFDASLQEMSASFKTGIAGTLTRYQESRT